MPDYKFLTYNFLDIYKYQNQSTVIYNIEWIVKCTSHQNKQVYINVYIVMDKEVTLWVTFITRESGAQRLVVYVDCIINYSTPQDWNRDRLYTLQGNMCITLHA